MSKKLIIISSIAIVVIAALIASFAFVLAPRGEKGKLEASKTYPILVDVTTINNVKPSAVVIAPASQKWWDNLLRFSNNETLEKNIKFSEFSKNATYIAFTESPGQSYESFGTLGMATTFIVYKTTENARAAAKSVPKGTSYFVRGNLLLFLPDGAYSDVDYALTQYINSEDTIDASDIDIKDQAIWQINFGDFFDLYTKNREAQDIEVFNTTMSLLGITEESSWTGLSSDGLTWKGQFQNVDATQQPKPSEIMRYIESQVGIELLDGTIVYGEDALLPEDENLQSGIIYPRQSLLRFYMKLSSNNDAAGSFLVADSDETDPAVFLPKEEGLYKIDIVPNEWLSFMMAEDSSYPVTKFAEASITITDTDGSSTIKLTPLK